METNKAFQARETNPVEIIQKWPKLLALYQLSTMPRVKVVLVP